MLLQHIPTSYLNPYFSKHFKTMLNLGIATYINKEFFFYIWLSLVLYCRGRVGEATARRRTFIDQYVQRYFDYTIYERSELKYTQPSSLMEGLKIYTASLIILKLILLIILVAQSMPYYKFAKEKKT